jgi:dTMP kinase
MAVVSGRFLVLEGIDGCGKSTQAARLAEHLGAVLTFEMGATPLGRAVRELVLGGTTHPSDMAEALLIAADRAQHMAEVVEPALAAGRHVVSDRHAASTLAYQGWGRGLPLEDLVILIELATAGRRPDLTLLLDLPVELAEQRRRGDADRMEQNELAFFERVRAGYLAQAEAEPETWVVIDARLPLDEVSAAVDEAVASRGWR